MSIVYVTASSVMVIDGDIVTLNRYEAKELIERECQERLGMSAAEFVHKLRRGQLPSSMAVSDIEMLLRLVYKQRP